MYLIQNIQISMQNYYLKLLNMCKFAQVRKTPRYILPIYNENRMTNIWNE